MLQEFLLKGIADLPTPLVSSLFVFASAEHNPITKKKIKKKNHHNYINRIKI
jgi:hypothetical protein